MLEVGRVCVKSVGREAGRRCVIIDMLDENFVEVTGPKGLTGLRRRRVNAKHVRPLDYKLELRKGATDEMIIKAIEKAKLREFFEQGGG